MILKNLANESGLQFRRETRTIKTWVVEEAK